ncbi:MAG: tetratricopeptide repeat protein [Bryobacterales bacterium]|nr:tetratricopeptide repeat protein [Bryobacterales bacterium]
MMPGKGREKEQMAAELFRKAYKMQMDGEWDLAISLYKRSIELHPTAEAHTFLGWTYRFQGKLEKAIEECKKAIDTDPSLGNPYNDIGAYLIELGQPEEAIPWLEQATKAKRYDSYHYAWYNLGRVYLAMELFNRARECFSKSLELDPGYTLAEQALVRIRQIVQ